MSNPNCRRSHNPEYIIQTLTQITGFYNEIVTGCSGIFNATILNQVSDRVVNTKFLAIFNMENASYKSYYYMR